MAETFLTLAKHAQQTLYSLFNYNVEEYKYDKIINRYSRNAAPLKYKDRVTFGPIAVSTAHSIKIDGEGEMRLTINSVLGYNQAAFNFIYDQLRDINIIPAFVTINNIPNYGHAVSLNLKGKIIIWPILSGTCNLLQFVNDALRIRLMFAQGSDYGKNISIKYVLDPRLEEGFILALLSFIVETCMYKGGLSIINPFTLLAAGTRTSCEFYLSTMRGVSEESFLFNKLITMDEEFIQSIFNKVNEQSLFFYIFLRNRRDKNKKQIHLLCSEYNAETMMQVYSFINQDIAQVISCKAKRAMNLFFFAPLYFSFIVLDGKFIDILSTIKSMAFDNEIFKPLSEMISIRSQTLLDMDLLRNNINKQLTTHVNMKRTLNVLKEFVKLSLDTCAKYSRVPCIDLSMLDNSSVIIKSFVFKLLYIEDVNVLQKAIIMRNLIILLNATMFLYFYVDIVNAFKNKANIFNACLDKDPYIAKNMFQYIERELPKCLQNMNFLVPSKVITCHHRSCNLIHIFTKHTDQKNAITQNKNFFRDFIKPLFIQCCTANCATQIYDEQIDYNCQHESPLYAAIKEFVHHQNFTALVIDKSITRESFLGRFIIPPSSEPFEPEPPSKRKLANNYSKVHKYQLLTFQ